MDKATNLILNPKEYKGNWKSLFKNDNPIGKPGYIKVTNNEAGYVFKLPRDNDPDSFFSETKFIYGEGKDDYYLGTDHEDTKTFKFD